MTRTQGELALDYADRPFHLEEMRVFARVLLAIEAILNPPTVIHY